MKNAFSISLIILSIFIGGCCKEKIVQNPKTKLKSVYIKLADLNDTLKYYIYYDSTTNTINKVVFQSFDFYYKFEKINTQTIKVINVDNGSIISERYVHLNSNNRIICINEYESLVSTSSSNYYATYSSENADTVLQPDFFPMLGGYYIFSDIQCFDFYYSDGNCIQSKLASKNVFTGSAGSPSYDTFALDMSYNYNLKNENNLMPLQESISHFREDGDYISMSIFYILGMNGYYYTKPNKNLLQIKEYIELDGSKNNSYYEYQTDANKNVIEMCIRYGSTTTNCDKYFFTYY